MNDSAPPRVLVVTAHPDDVDFGVAGSVAVWGDQGMEVTYCVVTDGDAGGFDPTVPRSEIPVIRRAEQTAAAKVVGVENIHWLGYPDGLVEVTLELRHDLARVIRQVRPQRVVCPSPERRWDRLFASHPDHMAVGEATVRAIYPDARNPFTFPDLLAAGFEAHTVGEMWITGSPEPDAWVDVTDAFERKVAALRCHVSQEVDRDGKLEERMRSWLAESAEAAGFGADRLAEGFRRVVTG